MGRDGSGPYTRGAASLGTAGVVRQGHPGPQGCVVLAVVEDARFLLVQTVWSSKPAVEPSDATLRAALELARRNEVEAPFVRAWRDRLPDEARAIDRAIQEFRTNLAEACRRLDAAGIQPVLIKAHSPDEYTYTNFDLVVGADGYERAIDALRPWASRSSLYPLERATKILLYPPSGPAVHLHREVAWFDIPAVATEDLRRGAAPAAGMLYAVPGPDLAFRILLAHAAFQNLSLPLADLVAYRSLRPSVDAAAAAEQARRDGWGRGFRDAFATAERARTRLDRGEAPPLPARLPAPSSLLGGIEHALHLVRTGRPLTGAREAALRGPLVIAKLRRQRVA